jgi:F-type H+-transporting ATPase subunit gamma
MHQATEKYFNHEAVMRKSMPPTFLAELANHYLLAALHELFYSSLMAENARRLQHMDNTIHRIEKDSMEFSLKKNRLRQEEITEEIEVIMLSAEAMKLQ